MAKAMKTTKAMLAMKHPMKAMKAMKQPAKAAEEIEQLNAVIEQLKAEIEQLKAEIVRVRSWGHVQFNRGWQRGWASAVADAFEGTWEASDASALTRSALGPLGQEQYDLADESRSGPGPA